MTVEQVDFTLRPEAARALELECVKLALPKYRAICLGEMSARFRSAAKSGLLQRRIKAAEKILYACELCERQCKVDRHAQAGWCKIPAKMITSSAFQHWGEENFFIPSFTIFFWSCTFACQYCQNWTISQRFERGQEMLPELLAKEIDVHAPFCRNVNFVGGEPTPYLPFILQTLSHLESNIPVIWNSNFYMSEKSMRLLNGLVDVYLSDWKYWSDSCAAKLSKVQNYLEVIARNHKLAVKDAELVIRHLVLPSHFECCSRPILEHIANQFGKRVIINIMNQYQPAWNAYKYPEIAHALSKSEFQRVVRLARKLDLNFIT